MINTEHSTNRLRELLRSYIGRGGWPAELVSESTGIPTSTIYSHMAHDGNRPNSDHMLAYIRLFGPEFLNLWTQAVGITGAYRPKAIEGCKFKAVLHGINHASSAVARLSEAADDGIIDPSECRSLPPHIIGAATYLTAVAHHIEVSA